MSLAWMGAHAAERQVDMQAFAPEQGLNSLAANVLLRDRQGVLWVGTDSGLFRFDGERFVAVSTGNDGLQLHVNDLYQAASGQLWIGAARHLYLWQHERLRRVADVPVDDLRRIAGDGGQGVYVRHEHRLLHVTADGRVTKVAWPQALSTGALTDGPLLWHDGHLWTSCGPSLCMRDAGATAVWGTDRGVPVDQWISMRADARGGLWVGGNHHLVHLKAGAKRFEAVASANPLDALAVDGQGRVLAASAGHVSRWDGARWMDFGDSGNLQSAHLRDLCFDRSGAVWLASAGRGVFRWRGYGRFRNWGVAQGLDSVPTWAIARDGDGRLWLGNQRHGNLLEPGARRLSPWPAAMRRPGWTDAVAVLPHGRSVWVIYNRGTVVRYNLDSQRAEQVAQNLGWVKFGLLDGTGRIWFGTHGGLWRIDRPDAPQPQVRRMGTGLPDNTNYLSATRDASGRIWLATSHGLLRFAQQRFTRMRLPGAPAPGGYSGVAATTDGRLWVAPVAGGLRWTRPQPGNALSMHAIEDPLLERTALYSLEADHAGRLWATSDAGVDVLDHGHWQRLDRDDGLAWNDVAPGAFLEDADGSVWLGTSGGVSHVLHPQRLLSPQVAAPVILEADYGGKRLSAGPAQRLDWNGRALTVQLASTGVVHPATRHIEYRLDDGTDDAGWETTTSNLLRYAALSPGHYRFLARVNAPALRARSQSTTFDLVVVPPWWRSPWAFAGYALLTLLALLALWRLRSTQLLRRQAVLEHLVDVRTRELEADKRALEATRRALEYEATHDALTGLLARGAAVKLLGAALREATTRLRPMVVALIDLDHFKQVNDNYGHLTGDAVLVQCAQRLRRMTPESAVLGRFGGEELLAIWPGLSRADDVEGRFASLVEAEYVDGANRLRVSCSVGVTWIRPGDDVESVLRRADAALYQAKALGRARVERSE
ncbi:MAG: diguanylate cyclase [Oleiagrimonas sp.]|jgi:diguanylate cyclase (GGDEF)-like protein|nr:diguanylate cyclase [Oleiagrimonas sp.]